MLVLCGLLAVMAFGAFFSGSDHFINGTSLAISMLTLLLLPILQATQNRDGAALQAKLDELIRANETARNGLIGLERKPEHEIESMRSCDDEKDPHVTAPDAASR